MRLKSAALAGASLEGAGPRNLHEGSLAVGASCTDPPEASPETARVASAAVGSHGWR